MVYEQNNLSALAYANGFTLWHYVINGEINITNSSGYFNGAADMLRVGDTIMIVGGNGAATATVRRNESGKVELGFLSAFEDAKTPVDRNEIDPPLTEAVLKQLMRDARYWKHQDPAIVEQVRDGFRRLYHEKG